MTRLFLTGYEKESLTDFLDKLKKSNIKAVIDVRENPLSRKNGFSKNSLEKILISKRIRYYHFPKLGSPKKIRNGLRATGDYLIFFQEYRNYVKKNKSSIKELNQVISKEKSSTLLCFERYSELCHRTIVASEIIKLNPKIVVTPI